MAIGAGLLLGAAYAQAESSSVERFTARTVSMTPAGIELRIDVREWSDEASRSATVAALADGSGASETLRGLPTLGYVWRSDSGVGYAVKYAHRVEMPEGERLTFVTERRLGAYDFRPWTVDGGVAGDDLDYSVIELDLPDGGRGDGTVSLAAKVQFDEENGLVALDAAAPRVLADAQAQR